MAKTLTLRGRLAAFCAAADEGDAPALTIFPLLLGPTDDLGGAGDRSAYDLLCNFSPVGMAPPQGDAGDLLRNLLAGRRPRAALLHGGRPGGDGIERPYDLLLTASELDDDLRERKLGWRAGGPGRPPGAVCAAHLRLATRGRAGAPARQNYWRGLLAAHAGQRVEVEVAVRRYNYTDRAQNLRRGAHLHLTSIIELPAREYTQDNHGEQDLRRELASSSVRPLQQQIPVPFQCSPASSGLMSGHNPDRQQPRGPGGPPSDMLWP